MFIILSILELVKKLLNLKKSYVWADILARSTQKPFPVLLIYHIQNRPVSDRRDDTE